MATVLTLIAAVLLIVGFVSDRGWVIVAVVLVIIGQLLTFRRSRHRRDG